MNTTVNTVYADFNNCDIEKRVRLNTDGTIKDLERQGIQLREGMTLRACDDDLSSEGIVVFSEEENIWVLDINWELVQDL